MVITGERKQVTMAEDQVTKLLVSSTYIKLKLKAHEFLPVLGTSGKRIEAIQDDSGAYINTDFNEVMVCGTPEAVASAQGIIKEFLDTGRVIEVTERQAKILFGRGGWTVREIQDTTDTAITTVHEESVTDARKFMVYGLEKAQEKALKKISTMFEKIGV